MSNDPQTSILSRMREGVFVVVLTGLLLIAMYSIGLNRPWQEAAVFGAADNYMYYGPNAYYLDASLRSGVFPLWNPLILCGQPFAANPSSGAFYPPMLLRSLFASVVMPTAKGAFLSLFLMSAGHVLFASLGAYILARRRSMHRGGAVLAALLYSLSAAMMKWMPESWAYTACAAWFPWVLLSVDAAACAECMRTRIRAVATLAVFLGLSMLTGAAQLVLHVIPVAGIWWCVVVFSRGIPTGQKRTELLIGGICFAVALFLGCALAAPMILPALELAMHTPRGKTLGDASILGRVQYTPWGLVRDVLFYTGGPGLEYIRGIGLAGMVLAGLGLFQRERSAWLPAAVASWVLLDCSIGPPMPIATVLARGAFFVTDAPARVFVLTCLPLALLAGYGADGMSRCRLNLSVVARGAVLGWSLFAGCVFVYALWQPQIVPLSRALVIIPVTLFALVAFGVLRREQRIPASLFIAIAVVEVMLFSHEFVTHLTTRVHVTDVCEVIRKMEVGDHWGLGVEREVSELPNTNMIALTPSQNGFEDLYLSEVRSAMLGESESRYVRVLSPEMIASSPIRDVIARAVWLIPSTFEDASRVISTDLPDERIESVRWTPNRLLVTLRDVEAPQNLVFTDSDYPGWTAFVDGKNVEMTGRESAFKSVLIVPGTRSVEFLFKPRLVYTGLVMLLGACLTLIIALQYRATPKLPT